MSGYQYNNQPGGNPTPTQPGYYPPQGQAGYPGYPAPGAPAQGAPYGFNPYGVQPGQGMPGQGMPGQPMPGQGMPGQPISAMSYPGAPATAPPPAYGGYPGYPGVPGAPGQPGQPGMPAMQGQPGFPQQPPFSSAIEWIPSTPTSAHSLTDKAIVAGYEGYDGSPLWVIRARYEGDLIPGKLAVKHKAAYVPWGGKENAVQNFEVCCARPETVRWVESRDGNVPPNAVVAGNTGNGEPLYVGRTKQQGALTPGKVQQTHKVLYISFAGQEIGHSVYEVLCTA